MSIKIAVPINNGELSEHFGQASQFKIFDIEDNQISGSREEASPPHEPGVIPQWMTEQGVDTLIAGCISANARDIFLEKGVSVVSGAPPKPVEELVNEYLAHTLATSGHVCQCNHH